MHVGRHPIWLTLLVLLTLGSTIIAFRMWMTSLAPVHIPVRPKEPDSYMKGVTYTEYDATTGLVHIVLKSPYSTHIPANNMTTFLQPRIQIWSADHQSYWTAAADYGQGTHGTDIITLRGHVVLHKPAEGNSPPTTILTEHLTYTNKTKIISTPDFITLIHGNTRLTGTGALINVQTAVYQLLSNVEGVYVPDKAETKVAP